MRRRADCVSSRASSTELASSPVPATPSVPPAGPVAVPSPATVSRLADSFPLRNREPATSSNRAVPNTTNTNRKLLLWALHQDNSVSGTEAHWRRCRAPEELSQTHERHEPAGQSPFNQIQKPPTLPSSPPHAIRVPAPLWLPTRNEVQPRRHPVRPSRAGKKRPPRHALLAGKRTGQRRLAHKHAKDSANDHRDDVPVPSLALRELYVTLQVP